MKVSSGVVTEIQKKVPLKELKETLKKLLAEETKFSELKYGQVKK